MSAAAIAKPAFDLSQVHRQILYPRISRLLYNPSDEPIEFTLAARTFVIPARDEMAEKESWLAGQCPVPEGFHVERRQWFAAQEYPPQAQRGCLPLSSFYGSKKVVGIHGLTVYEILPAEEQAVSLTGLQGNNGPISKLGVRLLSGDPEIDEAIKADADAAWKESAYLQDIMLVRSHEQINAKMTEIGSPLRPPSERVKRAMMRKLDYERAGRVARLYECPVCAEQHSTVHDRDTHIVTFHPEKAGAMGLGLGRSYDLDGNPISVDVAARYAQGVTGAVHGYREVTRDARTGEITSEKWVGESPDDAAARLATRGTQRQSAVSDAVEGTLNTVLETMAAMQARIDELAADNARMALAKRAAGETSRVRRAKAAPVPEAPKE